MAKKAAKAGKKAGKAGGRTRAAATSTGRESAGTARRRAPRAGATSPAPGTEDRNRGALSTGVRAADAGIGGFEPPEAADTVDAPNRPNETELSLLQRDHETALATGQVQPHPTMAPRAARTSPDSGPVGHAHQPLVVDLDQSKVGDGIKVRATEIGYYAERRRRPGDVFIVTPREGFPMERVKDKDGKDVLTRNGRPTFRRSKTRRLLSAEEQLGAWMEPVDGSTPERGSTSADVLAKTANGKSRAADADTL